MNKITLTCLIILCVFPSALLYANDTKDKQFVQSPLCFIENKGQITDKDYKIRHDIDFKVAARGISIFIGDGQLHYQWIKDNRESLKRVPSGLEILKGQVKEEKPLEVTTYRMDVELIGANMSAPLIKEERQEYYENYYLPSVPGGVTAKSYSKIVYKDVYPNIDWILYSKDNELKHEFVVRPGGNVNNIKLRYVGAEDLHIREGAFTAVTPFGSITEAKPYSYELESGREVASAFSLNNNILNFTTASHTGTLVIDPELLWSTYYGGSGFDFCTDVTADNAGTFAIATGQTYSAANIATAGVQQQTLMGGVDGFIVAFNPNNGTRKWGTYYGGVNGDYIMEATSGDNKFFIAGATNSPGLATPGAFQDTLYMGFGSGFVASFNLDGLVTWCTYYSVGLLAPATATVNSINFIGLEADKNDNVYFAGKGGFLPLPSQFPVLTNAPFIVKLNGNGYPVWAIEAVGIMTDIAIDDVLGNVYAAGSVYGSSGGVPTPGAHQTAYGGGMADAYLAKYSAQNGQLAWATLYGGYQEEEAFCTAVDDDGNPYLSGYTHSSAGIATPGAFMEQKSTAEDCFIAKFTPLGTRLWGTYYGGIGQDDFWDMATNGKGDLIIAGFTTTYGLGTPFAFMPHKVVQFESILIAKFNKQGQRVWATYFYDRLVHGCHFQAPDMFYIAGSTYNPTKLSTPGTHQATLSGTMDGFITKIRTDEMGFVAASDTSVCLKKPFAIHYNSTNTIFNPGNTFAVQMSDASGSFANPSNIGTLNSYSQSGLIYCTVPGGQAIQRKLRVISTFPADTTAPTSFVKFYESSSYSVTITRDPAGPLQYNQAVDFYAHISNPAEPVTYQWYVGSNKMPGAVNPYFSTHLQFGLDEVSVMTFSKNPCTDTPNKETFADITLVGIDHTNPLSSLRLSPNPNNGSFTISGNIDANELELSVVNSLGQRVYGETVNVNNNYINKSLNLQNLPSGIYMLMTENNNTVATTRFVITQ